MCVNKSVEIKTKTQLNLDHSALGLSQKIGVCEQHRKMHKSAQIKLIPQMDL